MQVDDNNSDVKTPNTCICKPRKCIQDLLQGNTTWSNWSGAQKVFPGVQLRTPEEAEAFIADWAMNPIDEYTLATETMSSKALGPQSLSKAKSQLDWKLWEKAIEEELVTLKEVGTWKLVDMLGGVNVVGSKWVFHAKKDAAGNVICYKVCLVAQGFSQVPGGRLFQYLCTCGTASFHQNCSTQVSHKDETYQHPISFLTLDH